MKVDLPYWIHPWTDPRRYKIAYGGRGSSKSWNIARLLLIIAASKKTRILCAREYQASIAHSVHQLLDEQILLLGLPGFHVAKTEIVHDNGSNFMFKGLARNIENIRSTEGIDICWTEEAQTVTEASWRALIPTVRKDDSEIWVSFNPRYLDDPTSVRFLAENNPERAIVSVVNYSENPFFPSVLRAEMKDDYKKDPEMAEHVWGGKPLSTSKAQILSNCWRVEEINDLKSWDGPYYGIDWGIEDPTVVIKCWQKGERIYIERELYASDVRDMPVFISKMPGLKEHSSRADSSWPATIRDCQNAGFSRMRPVQKWSGSVLEGIKWLRSKKMISINPHCVNTIREAGYWRWRVDKAGNIIPDVPQDGNDHSWDAVRYAFQQLIKQQSQGKIYHG